ncbi:hypothetical protein HELRODRAFT_179142 [Helobdella robusta]|uniref:Uncharacterized protein n=1 Tax=Helobdella robusta TaxID=6412 RepID=T1FE85_HELRO|nr:hypothetical protein HELRODRAFT_179142 [Helobdella robusta]ESN95671.1 hypothetical protein HELRODRAFT_179142 [Helobdella robusta]
MAERATRRAPSNSPKMAALTERLLRGESSPVQWSTGMNSFEFSKCLRRALRLAHGQTSKSDGRRETALFDPSSNCTNPTVWIVLTRFGVVVSVEACHNNLDLGRTEFGQLFDNVIGLINPATAPGGLEQYSLKLEKMEKFPSRENSKREKLLECLTLFRYIKNNNLLDKISLFCSSDINKISNTENWLKINFDFVNKQIKEMLFSQQAEINKMFLSYTTELDNVKNKLNSLVANNVSKKVNIKSVSSNNVNNPLPPINQNAPRILWADVVSSPTLDEAFTLVKRHNKRPRLNVSLEANNNGETTSNNNNVGTTSNNNNENTANIKTAKKTTKVIGKKVIEDCKLRADKNLIKKSVFSMSNLSKCHRRDVVEFLTSVGINVITCYPVIKKSEMSLEKNLDKDEQDQRCLESASTVQIQR